MPGSKPTHGPSAELAAARAESRGLFVAAGVFSFAVNLLMFTGPLFMLQVYDRVLGSRSEETLAALFVLMTFLFAMMGTLDYLRGRVMVRIGARFQARLDRRIFAASLRGSTDAPGDPVPHAALRDLEAIRALLAAPVLLAVFDIPWTPLFVAAIFVFHPAMGALAIGGGVFLVVVALANQSRTRAPTAAAAQAAQVADGFAGQIRAEAGLVRALGMETAAAVRWDRARGAALAASVVLADRAGGYAALSRIFRQFLQSAMLGLGAFLVLRGQLTSGAMIAASILMGRALGPIEVSIGQWGLIARAREGWRRLGQLLDRVPPEPARMALPRPAAELVAEGLTVVPPGTAQAVLRGVSFAVRPGQAMGVIGPSGAGKSSLAQALTGAWAPTAGHVRLGGADLARFAPDVLGALVGYLPQRVALFDGTIADNIARLAAAPDAAKVVAAARAAAAHEMILRLPEGYDTRVSAVGGRLSGGQMQRIGLARALYGDPAVLILDEPNSNLDNDGSEALNTAIRGAKAAGRAVLIMAHRPAAIQECDLLLVLDDGTRRAFGPRDAVLRSLVENHAEILRGPGARTQAQGGAA